MAERGESPTRLMREEARQLLRETGDPALDPERLEERAEDVGEAATAGGERASRPIPEPSAMNSDRSSTGSGRKAEKSSTRRTGKTS